MSPLTLSRKRSLADMQHTEGSSSTPPIPEFNDREYIRGVLQLDEAQTEAQADQELRDQAAALGITISRPATPRPGEEPAQQSMCESADTTVSHHARTASTGSQESHSTGITSASRSSSEQLDCPSRMQMRRRPSSRRRSLSFSEYEKYLTQAEAQDAAKMGLLVPPIPADPAPSLFSVSTRRSYVSIRNGLKTRFRLRRATSSQVEPNSCVCCREDFKRIRALHRLPCSHQYCDACLRVLINQAATEESKMPPRCCSIPIPGCTIKSVLDKDAQRAFMKSVLQFSTPWSARIFCPSPTCGEFIPKPRTIDPKHPFEVVCRKCRTSACSTCKRAAHAFGQDCPSDWELDAVLQMGEKSGWRRCYKCRNLVELTQGCSHITCRCKAQFCYICGAVWDPVVGCPNYCNGDEELERRRLEEEARVAELEAEKLTRAEAEKAEAAAQLEAEKRTAESEDLNALRAKQIAERDRFIAFERKMKWLMWTRHGQAKLDILEKYAELQAKMRERHVKTANHLEDRQVAAEMELRATLKQAERSVQIRLRHMEAYCDGLGRSAVGANPARTVTERDLRELGQQYNLRDDLERLHQSRVNVLRDKQARQMENLLGRQGEEVERVGGRERVEVEGLEEGFGVEEESFVEAWGERRARLGWRWGVEGEVLRRRLEAQKGVRFARLAAVEWGLEGEDGRGEELGIVEE